MAELADQDTEVDQGFPIQSHQLTKAEKSACVVSVNRFRKVVTTYETFILFRLVTETTRQEYPGSHFEVERRYSEFEWLHARLSQQNPSVFVPPLPGKMLTTALDRFSDQFLKPRTLGLQLFISRLSRHPVLSTNPDLIAFLTLLREDFVKYRSSHATSGILSNILSDTRSGFRNLLNNSQTKDEVQDPSATAAALGLIGSSVMHRYEREFQGYDDDVETFLSVAQRLTRATEFVANQLENLGMGFTELAHCLEMWPSRLVVDCGGRTVSDASKLEAMTTSNSPANSILNLKWDRNRPLAPATIANATKIAAKETSDLASCLKSNTLVHWRDAAQYAQVVRNVLNNRDNLENRYFDTVEDLKVESEQPPRVHDGRFARLAKTYFSWHQRPLSQLVSSANELQDQLTISNGQIRAEFGRWREERRQELIENLLNMSKAYTTYWSRVADAWRHAATELGSDRGPDQNVCDSNEAPSHDLDQEESAPNVSSDVDGFVKS